MLRHDLDLTLNPRVLRLVHEQSRGNPLFVLEIGRALLQRGIPEAGKPLGVPGEMADVLGLRVRDLPDDQRTVLLAVALDGQLSGTDLVALAGLEPVERAVHGRLVTIAEAGRARPWHPLLAAAARETATPVGRQDMHRRLAEVVSRPEHRVRHLALASAEPDEELAAALSESARLAGDRGATETALELAELALARTPDGFTDPHRAGAGPRQPDGGRQRDPAADRLPRGRDRADAARSGARPGPADAAQRHLGERRPCPAPRGPRARRVRRGPADPGPGARGQVVHRRRHLGRRTPPSAWPGRRRRSSSERTRSTSGGC